MKIGLIDVDGHNFPNIALMKISAYYKNKGANVEWYNDTTHYEKVFMSKVFSDVYSPDIAEPQNADEVIKGGAGYAIKTVNGVEIYNKKYDKNLPYEIEHVFPDYSLYPQYTGYGKPKNKQTAYGFLTRGCPRGCDFCVVASKEGRKSVKVADLNEFWNGQANICLSDPNILACEQVDDLFQQLSLSRARIDFNQGLDARLITNENAKLLANMNLKSPHFAMDNMKDVDRVVKGLNYYVQASKSINGKWNWRNANVFCLTNFNTNFEEDMYRIKMIQSCECHPFVMIYNKPSAPKILRRLQRWANNVALYAKTKDFFEYQKYTYKKVLYGKEMENK